MNFHEIRKITERGINMKRTHLIAMLVGIIAVGIFAADASAMYHPGMGVFMSRDPGAGGAMRIGAGGPAVAGGFIPRDAIDEFASEEDQWELNSGQYADGMNLYQYVLGNPDTHVDPTGLSSRKTKYWHFRGYGDPKIYSFLREEQHSVISVDRSKTEGVDYGPRAKKQSKKGKKIDGLAWLFWGAPGYTDPWRIQLELDYSRTREEWQLCVNDTGTMKDAAGEKAIECKCATEDQIKSCIEGVAGAWKGKTWKRGHDCRHFVQAAESECCLERCSP